MTLAELIRALESKKRVLKQQQQEKASYDYILADLIGRSISRIYNSSNTMPDIAEVYSALFNAKEIEEQRQEKRNKLSALRFRQFAQAYNKNFNKGAAKNE